MVPALSESISTILAQAADHQAVCHEIALLLPNFLRQAHRLPQETRSPDPAGYRRTLLHEARDGAFSIGCFVWSPGQRTPIHDHTAWGVIGIAAGALRETSYRLENGRPVADGSQVLVQGACAWCLPADGDIHQVGADGNGTALSIHVYGARFAEICRTRYQAAS